MKNTFKILAVLALICSAVLQNAQAQVANWDFEITTNDPNVNSFRTVNPGSNILTGWTVAGSAIEIHHRGHHINGPMLGNNLHHVDLNSVGQISQQVTLVQGQMYRLSFIQSRHSMWNGGGCSAQVQIGDLSESWNRVFNNQVGQWVTMNFLFTAQQATETLSFTGLGSNSLNGGMLIDSVVITPLDPCFGFIEVDTLDCDGYSFGLVTPNLINVSSILHIDGTPVFFPTSPIYLPKGNHEICFSYFGYDTLYDNVCCDSICTNLYVEGIDTMSDTVSYCDIDFSLGYGFDPCVRHTGYPLYQINSGGITSCQPPATIYLPEGGHTLRYYDDDTCLRLLEYFTVIRDVPDTLTCERDVVIPCDIIPPSYDDYTPTTGDGECDCGHDPGDVVTSEIILLQELPFGYVKLVKEFKNHTKCTVCYVTYTIIDEGCDFTPNFLLLNGTAGPDKIKFIRDAPTVACSTEVWTLTDTLGNVIQTRVHNPAQNPAAWDSMVGLIPGQFYILHMEVCVCICDTPCCKEVSAKFLFNPSAPAMIYENPVVNWGEHIYEHSGGGVPDDFANLELVLVPNPTSSTFRVEAKQSPAVIYDEVAVYNVSGQRILEVFGHESEQLIDLGDATPGTYFVLIKQGDYSQTLKLIRE